jgi:hypothetical protein
VIPDYLPDAYEIFDRMLFALEAKAIAALRSQGFDITPQTRRRFRFVAHSSIWEVHSPSVCITFETYQAPVTPDMCFIKSEQQSYWSFADIEKLFTPSEFETFEALVQFFDYLSKDEVQLPSQYNQKAIYAWKYRDEFGKVPLSSEWIHQTEIEQWLLG